MQTTGTLVTKNSLVLDVYELVVECIGLIDYTPGQFLTLEILPAIRRSFSIVSSNQVGGQTLFTLIVKAAASGNTEKWLHNYDGESMKVYVPLGRFIVKDSFKPVVCIATNTGIAPFIPMIKHIYTANPKAQVDIYFGMKHKDDDYALEYFRDLLKNHKTLRYFLCLSQGSSNAEVDPLISNVFSSRVTEAVISSYTYFDTQDFYICGNPDMVADMQEQLTAKGAQSLTMEKYMSA
jgi:all-trans-retinol 13,14-reductase